MHSVAAQGMHTVAVLDGRALMLRMSQKLSSVELGDIFENAIKKTANEVLWTEVATSTKKKDSTTHRTTNIIKDKNQYGRYM
jgi:hypothetical protein